MFKAGDIFTAKLPRGYYGAFRIIKAGTMEYTEEELRAYKLLDDESYLIAVTQYFDKEKPKLSDPHLLKVASYGPSSEPHIYVYGGYKYSGKVIKKHFEHIGNIPPTEEEMKLKMRVPTGDDPSGFSGRGAIEESFVDEIFYCVAPNEESDAYVMEMEATRKSVLCRLKDGEGDKFFRIESYGNGLVMISGKAGTAGKGKAKKYDSQEELKKDIEKLVAEKLAEGYELCTDYFIDDYGKVRFNDSKHQENSHENPTVSIHEAYRYQDEKSDKFWRIEYADNTLVVNYGKTGAIGKYQVKEFDDDEACVKEAKKLIVSKVKKGYKPYPEFDPDNHFYFDDKDYELGLHRLTSHPKFREHFSHDLYYDCTDEFAPFGSDEGSDTLDMISEYVRKNKSFNFTVSPKEQVEIDWGSVYCPPNDISREAVEALLKADNGESDQCNSDMVTYSTAFAQIKITGRIDAELKQMALNAMKRMDIAFEILGDSVTREFLLETQTKMIKDLEGFAAT
ncbi:MAG: WGR domain-containing protein [Defluviitaleaceae bacterium]|nr:WGR domain-containing protein [Defluviitaleaceae bacterium]